MTYEVARADAQRLADLGGLRRLRRDSLYGGWVHVGVPALCFQFGADLEGELIQPDRWELAKPLLRRG